MPDDESIPRSSYDSSAGGGYRESASSPLPTMSPSASLLRSSASLDRLTRRLGELQDESDEDPGMSTASFSSTLGGAGVGGAGGKCCCGLSNGCRVYRGWSRMEEKLKLSGGQSCLTRGRLV